MRNPKMIKNISVKCMAAIMGAAAAMSPLTAAMGIVIEAQAYTYEEWTASSGDVAAGETVGTNSGTITNNHGTVANNAGTITNNCSDGIVENNNSGGRVTTNEGEITNNQSGGTVTTNASGGTITNNSGTVGSDYGSIGTNYSGGTVTVNSGGTIATNSGANVYVNGGTITTNYGSSVTVQSGGMIATNSGATVTVNDGTITTNYGASATIQGGGTVITNSGGAVTINNGGTVVTNYGSGITIGSGGTLTTNSGGSATVNAGGTITTNYGSSVTNAYGGTISNNFGGVTNSGVVVNNKSGGEVIGGEVTNNAYGATATNANVVDNYGTVNATSGGSINVECNHDTGVVDAEGASESFVRDNYGRAFNVTDIGTNHNPNNNPPVSPVNPGKKDEIKEIQREIEHSDTVVSFGGGYVGDGYGTGNPGNMITADAAGAKLLQERISASINSQMRIAEGGTKASTQTLTAHVDMGLQHNFSTELVGVLQDASDQGVAVAMEMKCKGNDLELTIQPQSNLSGVQSYLEESGQQVAGVMCVYALTPRAVLTNNTSHETHVNNMSNSDIPKAVDNAVLNLEQNRFYTITGGGGDDTITVGGKGYEHIMHTAGEIYDAGMDGTLEQIKGTGDATVANGGTISGAGQDMRATQAGGTAANDVGHQVSSTIAPSGVQTVHSGGTASDTTVYFGGTQTVHTDYTQFVVPNNAANTGSLAPANGGQVSPAH